MTKGERDEQAPQATDELDPRQGQAEAEGDPGGGIDEFPDLDDLEDLIEPAEEPDEEEQAALAEAAPELERAPADPSGAPAEAAPGAPLNDTAEPEEDPTDEIRAEAPPAAPPPAEDPPLADAASFEVQTNPGFGSPVGEAPGAPEAALTAEEPAPPPAEAPDQAPADELPPPPRRAEAPDPEQDPARDPDQPLRKPSGGGPRLIIAIASGKGGVGKTLLAASIGIYLAQLGRRVVLVDGHLGSANLHTLLGMDEPRGSLHSFLRKEVQHVEEVVSETPFAGLGLVPGHEDGFGGANPRPAQKKRLISQLRTISADYLVLDLGAGSGFNVLDLLLAADLQLIVTVPEPTAVESAFRMLKSAFVRKVRDLPGVEQLLADLAPSAHGGIPTPHQMYVLARERDPELGAELHQAMADFKPRLVVNKTRTRDDLELGPALATVGRRHLGLPLDYLGYVENDDMVWVTVRKRRPLLVEYHESLVSKDLERVSRRILSLESKERPECMAVPKFLSEQNHYEVLGLHPGAIEEEVRRAQRRVRRIYSPESTAIYGIAPPLEVDQMHRRIDDAYATLVDPEKRHLYNQALFPGGREPKVETPVAAPEPSPALYRTTLDQSSVPLADLPPMPEIGPDDEFSGDLLRQVREALGIELADIAARTKISMTYLRAIEDEDYRNAPAKVYLRGFVKTVARELKLDPERVAGSYIARYQAVME